MLERHDSDCAGEKKSEHRDDREEQADDKEFSPRAYQQGFWS
ncbi:hypothetical protein [Bosea sp. NBC_00550]|nr:hypothetical protein [Bosea sp. NBC_00550]UZF92249.1 hypothetical protein NWE53_24830 [Bosea sp. NBC_00550]